MKNDNMKKLPKRTYSETYKFRRAEITKESVETLIKDNPTHLFADKKQVYDDGKKRVESITIRLEYHLDSKG